MPSPDRSSDEEKGKSQTDRSSDEEKVTVPFSPPMLNSGRDFGKHSQHCALPLDILKELITSALF